MKKRHSILATSCALAVFATQAHASVPDKFGLGGR